MFSAPGRGGLDILDMKTGGVWKWGAKEQAAFDALKRAITTKCVGYFNKEWKSILKFDASPVGLGAVLQQ